MKFQVVETRLEQRQALYARALEYAELYKTMTLQQIAAREGVTRERIRQILKVIGITKTDGWRHKLSLSKSAVVEAMAVRNREERCQSIYGCDWNTYCAVSGFAFYKGASEKAGFGILTSYHKHRNSAHRLFIPWRISLPEYAAIVGDRADDIGRGKLHFARKDKNEPYSNDNCELISNSENSTNTRKQAIARETAENLRVVARMSAAGIEVGVIARTIGRSKSTVLSMLYRLRNRSVQQTAGE